MSLYSRDLNIRKIEPEEYQVLGKMSVEVYRNLPNMPTLEEQPEYYSMLEDVERRLTRSSVEVFVAIDAGTLAGGVTFVGDMADYGAAGSVESLNHSCGIRLLAVSSAFRGRGIGKALTDYCIKRALEMDKKEIALHTTRSMEVAWRMYEAIGFLRSPDLDFLQGKLQVFGFRLSLKGY